MRAMSNDYISRQAAIDALADYIHNIDKVYSTGKLSAYDCKDAAESVIEQLPSAQPEIVRCRECRYCKDVTSIHGECECPEMWQSLFGETTEVEAIEVHKDHYCGYAERRTDG